MISLRGAGGTKNLERGGPTPLRIAFSFASRPSNKKAIQSGVLPPHSKARSADREASRGAARREGGCMKAEEAPSTLAGTFRLFRLAGIDVRLHWSWFAVAVL